MPWAVDARYARRSSRSGCRKLKNGRDTAVGSLQNQLAAAANTIDKAFKEAFGKLQAARGEELQRASQEGKAALERLAKETPMVLSTPKNLQVDSPATFVVSTSVASGPPLDGKNREPSEGC